MLWYIISSQLVTLGLHLWNAHISQHYHAVYICRDGGGRLFVDVYIYVYTHELLILSSISLLHNSLIYCCCSVTDPGVPYNVTVRAVTAVGKGEPVSIVVFSVQQGKH